MKRNDPHEWTIVLVGRTRIKSAMFYGTQDEALAEADIMECEVNFTVQGFLISRFKPLKKR